MRSYTYTCCQNNALRLFKSVVEARPTDAEADCSLECPSSDSVCCSRAVPAEPASAQPP